MINSYSILVLEEILINKIMIKEKINNLTVMIKNLIHFKVKKIKNLKKTMIWTQMKNIGQLRAKLKKLKLTTKIIDPLQAGKLMILNKVSNQVHNNIMNKAKS